ncbi:MAG: N-6 DNA methylase [Cytophagales bacterium]|nr:N-6 DNA methylase [Cytophagales bacterium]MCA6373360.1 N-6 DNA methylase [Cytophagales bacterium]
MINKDNLKDLLKTLNFEEKGKVFSKHFPDTDAYLKVDFAKSLLVYPTDKGFVVNGEFTCNFTSDENFVVFECVHRLFTKGYKPEHIELEPKWKVGHGASGGRADILVKDNSGKSLLIIECKTEGTEFKKEWNNTLQRGGQMLTYAKQAGTTQYVCLYASDFADGKVIPNHYIISLKDNENLLEELADKKPLSFKEAKALEVEDIYKAWKETYNLDFATKGIFEDDILPYEIGKQKYSIDDLIEVGSKDIQSKYHEFATIMRQHNVSGRENAFDKLVNLFLCKIVDEAKNPKDLKFNWKGIAYDSYFDLQDRLQLLYQAGMKEFLGEDVTYIDNTAIDKAFRFFKKDPDATRETIKKYFRQLKFFTNNDFAFIDVHNEKLFYQNSEVLLKIVQMLQDTRLQSETQNQFLGDMFEGFLDNGVKQSEGQFFTPMPIVKFILNSLPLESIIQESELPPKAIDYACGAGHFLNELALQIKPFVKKHKEADIKEYYKEIVGIEKEYRLSKVAKVSAFMYGQDEIKITYADALGSKSKLQDNEYSVLVANPPYAVKGFLQTLSEAERKSFTLLASFDEKSWANNNSIETFFIERAKQLLKPGAVAGIILPSSILNNDATVYTNTREIIIKYFQILAITEFGSQTFGKTGTNTVTLFLRRKEENPAPADHWKNRVDAWFTDNEADAVYNDSNYISNYCTHIEIDVTQYKTLLIGKPSDELLKTEMFIDYQNAFDNLTEIKNLKKPTSAFSKKSKADQENELKKRFTEFLQTIEKDKLFFYVLASENKHRVLVVKSPTENKDQKKFLGYEWSSAKGNEGIKYVNQSNIAADIDDAETKEMVQKISGLHNINTPLYNPNNRNDISKINHYIQSNFLGKEISINDDLKPFVNYYQMVDLLDFSRKDFNKQIQLSPKKISTALASKFDSIKIENALLKVAGNSTKVPNDEILEAGKYPVVTQEQNKIISGYTNNKNAITDLPLIVFGDHSCTFKFVDFPFVRGADGTQLMKVNPNLFKPKCFYYLMDLVDIENKDKYERHFKYLANAKIPKLPPDVQDKIIKECEVVDNELAKAENENKKIITAIQSLINSVNSKSKPKKIKDIIDINLLTKDPTQEPNKEFIYVDIESVGKGTGSISYNQKLIGANAPSRARRLAPAGSSLISTVRPYLKGFAYVEEEFIGAIYSTGFAILQSKDESELMNKIIYYLFMYSDGLMEQMRAAMPRGSYPSINKTDIENFSINYPDNKGQLKLISDISKLEKKILDNQNKMNSSAAKKKEIIKKYL